MNKITRNPLARNWLSAAALALLLSGSTALNLWGWWQTGSALVVALALCATVVAAEVYGARGLVHASRARNEGRVAACIASVILTAMCVAWNAYSGHRALSLVDVANAAPQTAAHTQLAAAQSAMQAASGDLAAITAAESTDCGNRPICAQTRQAQIATKPDAIARRDAAIADIARAEAAIASAPPPALAIGDKLAWCLAALVEALKALAGWTIDRRLPKKQTRRRRRKRRQPPPKAKPKLVISNQPDMFS